jgi:hypothetical protein
MSLSYEDYHASHHGDTMRVTYRLNGTMCPVTASGRPLLSLTIALAIGTAQLGTAQLSAQQSPLDGVLRGAQPVARSDAATRCPDVVVHGARPFENVSFDGVGADSVAIELRCRVDTTYSLPTADGVQWLAAIYRRVYIGPSDSISRAVRHATRDTAVLITAALYSTSSTRGVLRPEWTGIVDESMTRSITPTLVSRPDGSALLSVLDCVNGTGGCKQSYLRRRGGRWTAVMEAFWKQIPPINNGRIGKGPGVDVRTLKGSYGVYRREDANCCPSREILLELAQRGDSLVLKTYRVRDAER